MRRLLLACVLFAVVSSALAATRTIANGGGNYNVGGTWVEGVAPTSADAVVATGTSGQLTITAAAAALTVDLTGYTNTLTINSGQTWTISGTVFKLASGMGLAGTGTVAIGVTCTETSAGVSVPWALTLTGSGVTHTLGDSWTVTGLVTLGASTATTTVNANTLTCAGGLSIGGTSSTVTGTTTLSLTGGTWQSSQTGVGALKNPTTIAGSITVSGTIRYNTGTLTYSSGTPTVSGSTLLVQAATTLSTNGMTWADVTIGGTTTFTITFGNAFQSSGLLSLTNTTSTPFAGNFAVSAGSANISGTQTVTLTTADVTISGLTTIADACILNTSGGDWNTAGLTTTGALTGTAAIHFEGSGGTWTGAAGALSNSVVINYTGTLTLSGTILFAASGTPTLTYTAGTVSAGTSVLSIASACTLNTNGVAWANVTISAALTLTINSLLTITGDLNLPNAAVTFAGSAGFTTGTIDNVAIASTAKTYTFTFGNSYRVTGTFSLSGATAALTLTLISSHGTSRVVFYLDSGALQDVGYVIATRIDSSSGITICDYKGTITNSDNWTTTIPPHYLSKVDGVVPRRVTGS